jgi:hypothetical protein
MPSHDGSQQHQLSQERLWAFYPDIPAALDNKELYMLHPVRYMPPHGEFYDPHDKERVRFPCPVKKTCKVCMGEKHVDRGMPCHRSCLACGGSHPTRPCPQIYNTVRSWKRFGWRMDNQGIFCIPASTQVKPSEDEVVLLKANGYVAHDWVYNANEAPVFLDGPWNRERRGLGISPSISVPYPRTSAQNSYRSDRSPSRDRGRDDSRSRRSRLPSRGRDSQTRYRDRSPAQHESVVEQLLRGIISGRLVLTVRPSPPQSPTPRHRHMNRRVPPALSSLMQNQQEHSALPRSVNRQVYPDLSLRTDLDTPNQRGYPDLSLRTDLDVPDSMYVHQRPDLSLRTDLDVPDDDLDLEYR